MSTKRTRIQSNPLKWIALALTLTLTLTLTLMRIHLGRVCTYPCFILSIVSKRDPTNDIHLSGLSTYRGLTVI